MSTSPPYIVVEDGPRKAYVARKLPGSDTRYTVIATARRGIADDMVGALTRVVQAEAVLHELADNNREFIEKFEAA